MIKVNQEVNQDQLCSGRQFEFHNTCQTQKEQKGKDKALYEWQIYVYLTQGKRKGVFMLNGGISWGNVRTVHGTLKRNSLISHAINIIVVYKITHTCSLLYTTAFLYLSGVIN